MYQPPLALIVSPVTKLDSSDTSHATTLAMSSGVPRRRAGVLSDAAEESGGEQAGQSGGDK